MTAPYRRASGRSHPVRRTPRPPLVAATLSVRFRAPVVTQCPLAKSQVSKPLVSDWKAVVITRDERMLISDYTTPRRRFRRPLEGHLPPDGRILPETTQLQQTLLMLRLL